MIQSHKGTGLGLDNEREKGMRKVLRCSVSWMVVLAFGVPSAQAEAAYQPRLPLEVRVLVVKYFPVKGGRIDRKVTGDWGKSLEATRQKTTLLTAQVARAL